MNWKSIGMIVVTAGLLVAVTACNGVTLSDLVEVEVPQGVQEETGEPAKVSLSKAPFVRQRYVDNVKNNLAEFDQDISDAQLFADFAGGLLNTGLTLAEGPLQGVPMGGVLFAALGGLSGLFVRAPGTQKKIDEAWDEASAKTREAMQQGKELADS